MYTVCTHCSCRTYFVLALGTNVHVLYDSVAAALRYVYTGSLVPPSILRDVVASSLRRFVTSSLRRFVASSLRRFVSLSLRRFAASSLQRVNEPTNEPTSERRFVPGNIERTNAMFLFVVGDRCQHPFHLAAGSYGVMVCFWFVHLLVLVRKNRRFVCCCLSWAVASPARERKNALFVGGDCCQHSLKLPAVVFRSFIR